MSYTQLILGAVRSGISLSPGVFSIPNNNGDLVDCSGFSGSANGIVLDSTRHLELQSVTNSTISGALQILTLPTSNAVRITSSSLTSLAGIGAGAEGQILLLSNKSGSSFTLIDGTGSGFANRVKTGTGANLTVLNDTAILLSYDSVDQKWQVIGGSGSGGGSSVTPASSVAAMNSFGLSSVVGTSTDYARADHVHSTPTAPNFSPYFKKDGSVSMTGNIDMLASKIVNLANGASASQDAATVSQMETALGLKLSLSGGTLSGNLNTEALYPTVDGLYNLGTMGASWNNAFINYINNPNGNVTAFNFVNAGEIVAQQPISMFSNNITGMAAGINPMDATNLSQVEGLISAISYSGLVPKTYTVNGHALSGNVTVTKTDVGLSNADNTSDTGKPVSTAQQSALDLKLNLTGGTMSGAIAMGSNKITGVANGTTTNDAVNYGQMSSLIGGLNYDINGPVSVPNMVNDSLTTPPVSPVNGASYLAASGASGGWTAGHVYEYNTATSTWSDVLGRAIIIGDRFGIDFEYGMPTAAGSFSSKSTQIATVTNATPGSYAYAFTSPTTNLAVYINGQSAQDLSHLYYFNSVWVDLLGAATVRPKDGSALSYTGNILNVGYDNVTIDLTSNHLEVKAGGISNSHINGSAAIAYSKLNLGTSIVNSDISTSAAIAYSKLNLSTSVVNNDISTSAAIAYSKLNLSTSIVNADISTSASINYSKLNLGTSIVNADISTSAAIVMSKLAALTAGKVLQSNASTGLIEVSSVTNATLAFLDASSSIQTQLNNKQAAYEIYNSFSTNLFLSAGSPMTVPGEQVYAVVGGVTNLKIWINGLKQIYGIDWSFYGGPTYTQVSFVVNLQTADTVEFLIERPL